MSDEINKVYISPYDKFLYAFDATHAKSASQLKEIKKHERIALLRDNKEYVEPDREIWTDF